MDIFQIGGHTVTWSGEYPLVEDGYCREFRRSFVPKDTRPIAFRCVCRPLDDILATPLLYPHFLGDVYETADGRVLVSHLVHEHHAFAAYLDGDMLGKCFMSPAMTNERLLNADVILNRAGLHRALLFRGAAVLHASYIDVGGEAILFTAPSGTGKSTQAALWASYAGAEIINGDRVLLTFAPDGRLMAGGYPVCGSSNICLDRDLPVRAIVTLSKAETNTVSCQTVRNGTLALFSAIKTYRWALEEREAALALARRVAESVPMYHLSCRPDRDAVLTLADHLQ